MDLQGVMQQLKAWEHPKMRAVNAKHGAGENQFGVNLGKLRGLAAKSNATTHWRWSFGNRETSMR